MGAGISKTQKYRLQYAWLQKMKRMLFTTYGLETTYKDRELRCKHGVFFICQIGPASNGESFYYMVLRVQLSSYAPSCIVKHDSAEDYSDSHAAKNPVGKLEEGIKLLVQLVAPTAERKEA